MNKSTILTGFLTILFYLLFLFLYLADVLDELLYLMILLLTLITLISSFFVFRKNRIKRKKIAIATSIIFVLFGYELLLIVLYTQSHVASVYEELMQTVKGTGIFILGVREVTLINMQSKLEVQEQLTKEQEEILTITAITNRIRYEISV